MAEASLLGEGSWEKGPEGNPSCSRTQSFLPLSRLPLILQSPSHLFSSYLLPLIFYLTLFAVCTFLSHTHTGSHARAFKQASAHPATIRQDPASASISRLFSIWQRACRPLRHSPVPPHSALLVTPDNWGRNPKFRNGGGKKKM